MPLLPIALGSLRAEIAALITASATLAGVIIAQAVTAWLAAERAQVDELQRYFKEMGELLTANPELREEARQDLADLRILTRAHTRTVWTGLNWKRSGVAIKYMQEAHLIDALRLKDLVAEFEQRGARRVDRLEERLQASQQSVDSLQNRLTLSQDRIEIVRNYVRDANELVLDLRHYTANVNQEIDGEHVQHRVRQDFTDVEDYLAKAGFSLTETVHEFTVLGRLLRSGGEGTDNRSTTT